MVSVVRVSKMDLPSHHISNIDPDSNTEIRQGVVTDIIYPDDARSINKSLIEYNVEIGFLSKYSNTATTITFTNLTVADKLGSFPDRERLVFRTAKTTKNGYSKGAKVLVAFIDGARERPVIVGGLRDIERDNDKDIKKNNIHYDRCINGIQDTIKVDGSFYKERIGPLDIDGKVTDKPKQCCRLEMTKDGSIQLALSDDSLGTPSYQFRLDTTDETAIIKAPKGLRIGKATDYMLLGTSYRNAQKELNKDLKNTFQDLVTQFSIIFSGLEAISKAITVPITGAVASGPLFAVVSQSVNQSVVSLNKAVAAISKFESNNYLSDQNKSD